MNTRTRLPRLCRLRLSGSFLQSRRRLHRRILASGALAQNMKNYIDKVPQLWVEAQVASLNGRGGNVFYRAEGSAGKIFSFTLALFGQAGRGLGLDVKVGARVVT